MCYSGSISLKPIRNALDVVSGYKSIDAYNTVFKEISPIFYRENYHSDLICYLLKNSEIRRCFLEWLSKEKSVNGTPLQIENIQAYDDAAVVREEGRIDIAVYSTDKTKVILIENKSNQTGDQHYQIPKYYHLKNNMKVTVECVVYLNRSELKEPRYAEWKDVDHAQIKPILLVTQLRGERSFSTNTLSHFLSETNDLRMAGVVKEIQLFFDSLVFGETNMSMLESFVDELAKDDNLKRLQAARKAYDDIPKFLANKYREYCEKEHPASKSPFSRYWIYKDTCLVLEGITFDSNYFAVDIWFSQERMDVSIIQRPGGKPDGIEHLRQKMGLYFPFAEIKEGRYRVKMTHSLDHSKIRETIDGIVLSFNKLSTLK